MSNTSGVVQYWVLKRPKTPTRVVYGAELSATKDKYGKIIKGETLLVNNGETNTTDPNSIAGVGSKPLWEPIVGQPWILHSIHFGVNEALSKAKPLIIAQGIANVKIVKTLNHEIEVKMV